MNYELMCNKDFIRCSVIVAELLIKYKSKEESEAETLQESNPDSVTYIR